MCIFLVTLASKDFASSSRISLAGSNWRLNIGQTKAIPINADTQVTNSCSLSIFGSVVAVVFEFALNGSFWQALQITTRGWNKSEVGICFDSNK